MKKHSRRPRAEYEALYERKLAERLTYEAIATDSGVPISTLQYWFRRFKAERGAAPATGDASAAFVRLDVGESDASSVEILIRDEIRLRVKPGFDEQTVRRLVRVLGC